MSMAWMRMPGQTWPGAAASSLGMWVVMTVAMLPSLVPMRWRYRQAVGRTGKTRLGRLAALEMQQPALARAVPIAVGVVVLIAGSLRCPHPRSRPPPSPIGPPGSETPG
jgi:hypothetical protein